MPLQHMHNHQTVPNEYLLTSDPKTFLNGKPFHHYHHLQNYSWKESSQNEHTYLHLHWHYC